MELTKNQLIHKFKKEAFNLGRQQDFNTCSSKDDKLTDLGWQVSQLNKKYAVDVFLVLIKYWNRGNNFQELVNRGVLTEKDLVKISKSMAKS